jgi:hypothetical protein
VQTPSNSSGVRNQICRTGLVTALAISAIAGFVIWQFRNGRTIDLRAAFVADVHARGGRVLMNTGPMNIDGGSTTIDGGTELTIVEDIQMKLEERRLHGLVVNVTLPSDAGLNDAARMSLLSDTLTLVIKSDQFGDEAMGALPDFPQITSLEVESNSLSARGLARLPEWGTLRTIAIRGKSLGDAAADVLNLCKGARRIDVSKTGIGDVGIRRLLANTGVEILYADHLGLSAHCIHGLQPEDVKLSGLSIAENGLDDPTTAFFYLAAGLRYLDVSSARHGERSANALAANTTLERLIADGIAGDVDLFLRALTKHTKLSVLSLCNVPLSQPDLKKLLRMPRLSRLSVSGCGIDESMELAAREELDEEGYLEHFRITVER